jgi:hypothetical protein
VVANAAISLLSEGTTIELHGKLPRNSIFTGVFWNHRFTRDFASVSFYTTGKHFYRSVDVLSDLLVNPPSHSTSWSCFVKRETVAAGRFGKGFNAIEARFFSALFGDSHSLWLICHTDDYDSLLQPT